MNKENKNILWFDQIDKEDIPFAGGKGANLGEMTSFLDNLVPQGFVVTAKAYFDFIEHNQLRDKVAKILEATNTEQNDELTAASEKIKRMIIGGEVPEKLVQEIINSYHRLGSLFGLKQALVAVRSSATAEDLPDASFAGQQETFLNIRGEASVVNYVRKAWASLFTPRAIFYREEKGFDHFKVGLAAVVQRMVQSETSGVMFTIDPVTNQKNKIVIEAIWGLGEYIVQGIVTPDHYEIEKGDYQITEIKTVPQKMQLIKRKGRTVKTMVPKNKIKLQKLSSPQIVELAKTGEALHKHYFFAQDIEWALEKGKLYILQTRPVTTISSAVRKEDSQIGVDGELVLKGDSASPGIGQGRVVIIQKAEQINRIKKGDCLIAKMTSPDYVPAMKKASAIVTELGGQTSHAAIVSRELGVPCVVGVDGVLKVLKNNDHIVVNGDRGEIWLGKLKKGKKTSKTRLKKKQTKTRTATKLYLNLAEPELAKESAKRDVDGVGLLRAEFMIAQIGIHPQKLIKEGKQELFIQKLSEGMLQFCKAFNPKPVVYRATDFKSNEYRHLTGGELFEPEEPNPLLGFRGAFRYISFPEVFQLELEAIKRVRNKHGFKNLWLMIPFVRTPKELLEVKRIVTGYGLSRSSSFKLWMMVEIPSNVISLKDFIKVGIDGVSIGSNDLTMLILGLDRDNSEVAYRFNEMDPSVLYALRKTIKTCNRLGITSSICGQAPSQYPEMVEKLVRWGVTSISVSPDAIERSRQTIAWAEKERLRKK
ncbi:phosphoenolpyruvate synthase [Patescibacteria group bacterium]|nr:phosphoenolpyruvate synthase [Patescibacteria group bacterium]